VATHQAQANVYGYRFDGRPVLFVEAAVTREENEDWTPLGIRELAGGNLPRNMQVTGPPG
jgi:hypothetical protein